MKLKPIYQSRTLPEVLQEFKKQEERYGDLARNLSHWLGPERTLIALEIFEAHCKHCHSYTNGETCHCRNDE